jgi:hypothetical protein
MSLTSRRFWRGAVSGVVGTLVMSIVMLVIYAAGASLMPEPIPLSLVANLIARAAGMNHISTPVVVVAIPIFLAYGAFWIGLLAVSTSQVTWRKGLVIGLGLWLVMMVFLLPLAGAETFRVGTSRLVWLTTLFEHAIYGITSGALVDRTAHSLRTAH